MSLLTSEQAKEVARTVERVELSTAGEMVVVVVDQSDDYAYPRALFALVAAIACGWLVYWAMPTLQSGIVFGAQAVFWALFYWLAGLAPVVRALVPKELQQNAVDAKAKHMFIEHGLTETRDRSGVLILVSEAEHRVQILADRGIHERVGVDGWQVHVQTMIDAIRKGEAAHGLMAAITRIGEVLSECFPARHDDTNELSNEVRFVDR